MAKPTGTGWRLIDRSPGLESWHRYDHVTKETTIYTGGNAEAGLEHSKELAKDNEYTKDGIKKSFWHYLHASPSVLVKWWSMGVDINRPEELVKMANKPEWSYVKTTHKFHK